MKTLNQSGFFKQGLRARKFVRIGNDILLPATAKLAGTSFDDTVSDFDGISQSIDPAGGLSVVSGAGVRDLILDRELTLCTAVDLSPKYDGVTLGAGRSIRQGSPFEPYSAVRNSTVGAYDSPAIVCGRSYNAGILSHTIYRGVLQFSVPSDVGTCEDAFLELTGAGLSSAASFGVYLFPGTWSSLGSGMHNDFTGWLSSGNYTTAARLNETWSTSEYGATTRIRLNAAGRQYLVNMAGQTARIMLVSNRDALWSIYSAGASGNEFVMFGAASALLRMRYNSKTLDNQTMSIYYAIENAGVLPASTSGMDLAWTGVVDSYEIGERTLSLEGRQNDFKKDRLVPRTVITEADFPECPEESIGKAVPVVYGDFMTATDHRGALASFVNGADSGLRYGNGDFVRGIMYDNDNITPSLIVAGHALKETGEYAAQYESALGSFALVAGDASAGSTAGRVDIQKGSANVFPYNLASLKVDTDTQLQMIASYIPTPIDAFSITDPDNAVNADPEDWSEIEESTLFSSYQFYNPLGVSNPYDLGAIVFETEADTGYDSGLEMRVRFFIPDGDPNLLETRIQITTDGQHVLMIPGDVTAYLENPIPGWYPVDPASYIMTADNVRVLVFFSVPGFTITKPFRFRNLCFLRGYSRGMSNEIYVPVKGRADDGSGTVTGTASALIENPSHVIESFARSEMGLDGTEINTASFDAAATALAGMELAFQLLERKRSRLLLDGIGKDGRVILGYDEADRLKARVLNPTAGFAGRGSDAESQVPRDYHIFTTTGTPANGVYANHQILGDLTIRQQDMDEVKNDFVLRYRKNYASNEYAEVLTCDKDATTVSDGDLSGTTGAALVALCLAAYARLGTVNTDEYSAEYIRDGATAARLLQHRVEWFSKRRNIIEFTAGISALMFEPGDFINVRHDRITGLYGDAVTERKKWMITDIRTDLNRDRITITAIEVD